ncbi:MAG: DEAD/DEAH box helicase [Desulfobacteraceae bacterium]|jgi:ATP-dependent RNA helicase DeaD
MTFDTLGLNPKLLKAVASLGFEHPTPIQEKVIATVLSGSSDLVGLAQTGTGKTAAYGLPLVQLIDAKQPVTQALVICPTRELCVQISGDLKALARYTPQTHIVAVYGGAGIGPQVKQIKKGAHIIVATPGRLLDLMQRKAVRPGHIRYCVLDEADEMLSMGFQEEIDDIIKQMPTDRRIWLFSATMPSAAARIAKAYMQKPVEISIGRKNIGAENILHTYYVIREKERYAALKRLIDHEPGIYGLIFCRTRQDTRAVAEKLMKEGYNTDALHGDLSQEQRNHVMRKFRERALQVLVATDVAARGLDVDDISHVIQYNLPDDAERYTHRSGRTARAGKSGASLLLVNTREVRRIAELERRSGVTFSRGQVPSGRAICEKQLFAMVDKMTRVRINDEQIAPHLQPIYEALGDMSRNELIQRFVSVEFNRFLDAYRDAGDLNVKTRKELSRPNRDKRPTGRSSQSFFINVGRKDNIREGAIVRLICDRSGIRSDKIGQIALKGEFSFFDVDKCVAQKVFKALKGARLDDRKIDIRFADKPKIRSKKRKWRRKK